MINNTFNDKIIKSLLPRYFQLKQLLIQDITNGKYPPDTKLPSKTELIKKYSVSDGTVKRTIYELVRDGFIYTIPGKGCYVANVKIKGNNNNNTKINNTLSFKRISLILPDALNEFYSQILNGIMKITQSKEYTLEIFNSEERYEKQRYFLAQYFKKPISGIIFVPTFYYYNYNHLFELQKKNIPVVLLDRKLKNCNFNYVGFDNIGGSKKAVKYLVDMGHRDIVFLGGHLDTSSIIERLEGYKQALIEKKLKVKPEYILTQIITKYESGEKEAYIKIKQLLEKRIKFTAIYSVSDILVAGAYRALKEKGLNVPNDVSIIGFGDTKFAREFEVPLTTIKEDPYRMGYYSAKLLCKIIESKSDNLNTNGYKEIFVPTKLIIRKSVRKIRN
jgi:DNA-binding LacI/PurR family transcriptional regulator